MTPRQLALEAMSSPMTPQYSTGRTTEVGLVPILAGLGAAVSSAVSAIAGSTIGQTVGLVGVSVAAQELFSEGEPDHLYPSDEERFLWIGAVQGNYAAASQRLSGDAQKRLDALYAMTTKALLEPNISTYHAILMTGLFERRCLEIVAGYAVGQGLPMPSLPVLSVDGYGDVTPQIQTAKPPPPPDQADQAADPQTPDSWRTVAIVAAAVAVAGMAYYYTRTP